MLYIVPTFICVEQTLSAILDSDSHFGQEATRHSVRGSVVPQLYAYDSVNPTKAFTHTAIMRLDIGNNFNLHLANDLVITCLVISYRFRLLSAIHLGVTLKASL